MKVPENSKSIQVVIPAEDHAKAKSLAALDRVTLAAWIVRAIEEAVSRAQSGKEVQS